ncbi:hypothetical protein N474_11505 [Pseudoalteromonas luteoviolacea CPMOR-2]|uniref:Uncharacterized protein n=1 Tax=Pseudoalteromonas luteoviolacea DSM 6061 TaxID=1365250 RepID=A0A166XXH2_9GAMM|nr:hypothetical protein N475_01135 [Pseudoalteromonas luteoviolacea DSM 6061]KZN56364.1 hypothetical protein N474_11505 [Pseudoalteromonas luteoviolacea CPMOR-2]
MKALNRELSKELCDKVSGASGVYKPTDPRP